MEDQIYIGQSVESDLMHLELFIFNEWNQVTCSRWLYSSENININMLAPSLGEDWNTRLRIERDQLKRFNFVILLNLS